MKQKTSPSIALYLALSLVCFVMLLSSCERLGNGVVREIQFPGHTPQLAVTLISRSTTDTLVARAHTSAGILDTAGSKRLKNALFTLSHENGTSLTWGGQSDWVGGVGHVITNVNLEPGLWTLQCEEENFETATAVQLTPPQIDSLGEYPYVIAVTLNNVEIDEYNEGEEMKYVVYRTWIMELDLPDRPGDRDFFVLKAQQTDEEDEEDEEDEFWENSTWISPEIEDDIRMTYNRLAGGWMIEDISDANSLNALGFEVNQYLSGSNLDSLLAKPAELELAALSNELAEYYRTLELIDNPSGGPLFTEPLLAFSNMSTGFGCFGLYTSCKLELTGE